MSATTPQTVGSPPPYRPALDGLRAIAVTGVLVFHLNPNWLPGGWFGVDLFFVLSGFLITTLIIREQNRTGRINFPRFWLARMRRLLPALITTLFAVLGMGWFLTIDARREAVAHDVLSALAYVANWRFIFGDEGYFATLNLPSPVRHTWSLSIEEQFYVVFPLLMAFLGWITTKRMVHTLVLTSIAICSAGLMAYLYVPDSDPVRVYFGTDTRIFELLIGAIGALALRKQAFTGFTKFNWLSQLLGALGLGIVVLAMFFIHDDSPIPYRGGLVLLCLASFASILAAAGPPNTLFSRIIGFAPLRWLGLISYPLYLWHWPVIVFMTTEITGLRGTSQLIFQAILSIVLATLSYKFIEQPIRNPRTWAESSPRLVKAIILSTIPLLVFTSVKFGDSLKEVDPDASVAGSATLEPMEVSASKQRSAMVFGNSIPDSLANAVQIDAYPYLSITSNSFVGCEPTPGIQIWIGKKVRPTEGCIEWRAFWPTLIKDQKPDVLVYFTSQALVSDWYVDGKTVHFGTRQHDAFLRDGLNTIRKTSLKAGAKHFAVSNLACHELPAFDGDDFDRMNSTANVKHINKVVAEWADENSVPVIDTYSALCPGDVYSPTVNKVPLYNDGLHFTAESGPIFWDWMAPQLIAYLEEVD